MDRDKVIKGLECCVGYEDADNEFLCVFEKDNPNCPYSGTGSNETSCMTKMMRDALALLKAQEPVEPTWKNGYPLCGKCGFKLHWIVEQNNYCANCGQAVKWE